MAGHLRVGSTVIDEETERAVAGWVKLGDQVAGIKSDEPAQACARCGSSDRVLARGEQPLCARCYLESGEQADTVIAPAAAS